MNQRQGSENSSDTWVLLHRAPAATCGSGVGVGGGGGGVLCRAPASVSRVC